MLRGTRAVDRTRDDRTSARIAVLELVKRHCSKGSRKQRPFLKRFFNGILFSYATVEPQTASPNARITVLKRACSSLRGRQRVRWIV